MTVIDEVTLRVVIKPKGWGWKLRLLSVLARSLGIVVELDSEPEKIAFGGGEAARKRL